MKAKEEIIPEQKTGRKTDIESFEELKTIEEALTKSWTLREKLTVLKTSMQRLDKIKESPRTEVVLKVLNYAKERTEQTV